MRVNTIQLPTTEHNLNAFFLFSCAGQGTDLGGIPNGQDPGSAVGQYRHVGGIKACARVCGRGGIKGGIYTTAGSEAGSHRERAAQKPTRRSTPTPSTATSSARLAIHSPRVPSVSLWAESLDAARSQLETSSRASHCCRDNGSALQSNCSPAKYKVVRGEWWGVGGEWRVGSCEWCVVRGEWCVVSGGTPERIHTGRIRTGGISERIHTGRVHP